MDNEEGKIQADLEWEQRTLCIDESCIGVIGPDGRCKECGLPYESGKHEDVQEEQDLPETASEKVEELEVDDEDDENESMTDSEWEQRTLCRDESCIGVIGPGGCCKECGLPYKEN